MYFMWHRGNAFEKSISRNRFLKSVHIYCKRICNNSILTQTKGNASKTGETYKYTLGHFVSISIGRKVAAR